MKQYVSIDKRSKKAQKEYYATSGRESRLFCIAERYHFRAEATKIVAL